MVSSFKDLQDEILQIEMLKVETFFWGGSFETGFLCSFGACPGIRSIDQAGLEFTEICLPLPP